jgi:hypothetical protein
MAVDPPGRNVLGVPGGRGALTCAEAPGAITMRRAMRRQAGFILPAMVPRAVVNVNSRPRQSAGRRRDSGARAQDGVARQRLRFPRRTAQLPIDGQPGEAVDDCPDESRELQRIVPAHQSGLLLRDEGIDEHLERPGRLPHQIGIGGAIAQESAEHHSVVRGVRHGKADVRVAHRLEPFASAPARLPRREELEPQRAESFPRHGREKRRFVGEMTVERRSRDTERLADRAQGEPLDALHVYRAHGFLQQGALEVAVMIAMRALAGGAGGAAAVRGSGHSLMVDRRVDIVNIRWYVDVDIDNMWRRIPMTRFIDRSKTLVVRLWRTDAPLTGAGLLLLAALAVSLVGLAVDPRTIAGAPAWLKPAKFAISTAIFTLTLAWVFTHLPSWTRTRRLAGWATAVALVLEVVIIGVQAWRGTTSHFNYGTPLDFALWTTMGLAIVVQTLASIAVAFALWREPFTDRAIGWALRLGLTIAIIGAASGGLMTAPTGAQLAEAHTTGQVTVIGAHTVGAPDGGPGLPGTGWSLKHGDLRVPHFLGLHAMQALPLFALAFHRRRWTGTTRVRLTIIAAASYVSLFAILLSQALRGVSVVSPDAPTIAALAIWLALTSAAAWSSISTLKSQVSTFNSQASGLM